MEETELLSKIAVLIGEKDKSPKKEKRYTVMKKSPAFFRFSLLLIAAAFVLCSCGAADYVGMTESAGNKASVEFYSQNTSKLDGFYDIVEENEVMDMDMPQSATDDSSYTSDPAYSQRKIIYSSWFNIQTEQYEESVASLKALCDKYGAYFENSESYGNKAYSTRTSSYKIRVPADNYQSFISEAGNIGTIVGNGENNSDVTENYFDTQARLESAQLREERLLEILANAGTLDDVLLLERELSDVRYEIESYTGSLRKLDSLISYATCSVNIEEVVRVTSPTAPTKTLGQRISAAFSNGLSSLADGASELLIQFTYSLPYIVIIWIPIIVIVLAVVLIIKKKRTKKSKVSTDSENENPGV